MGKQSERMSRGAEAIGSLLGYWLSRSDLAYDPLSRIFNWGLGERSGLQSSVISRIRNGMQPRGAGLAHLDAMAQGNEAIWCWQTAGEQEAIKRYGNYSGWGVKSEWLDRAVWLQRIDDEREPLDLGDLAMVAAGRLELPYISSGTVAPGQAVRLADGLLTLVDGIAMENGWSPREAVRQFMEAYPSQDRGSLQRLRRLVLEEERLSSDEIEREMPALAEMIRRLRGEREYGPVELKKELLTEDR